MVEGCAAVRARKFDGQQSSFLALVAVFLVVYWPTFESLGVRWSEQGPYDHGWVVLAGLIWLLARRPISIDERRSPGPWTLLPLIGLSAMWSVALLANVTVVQHALLFAVIGVAGFALLGVSARHLVWAFLLLGTATPAWDAAIPLLQPIAVLGASAGVSILGIPAVIEAYRIEIPAGVFQIAEGCSGLRYVLSAFALAVLAGEVVGATTRGRLALIAIAGAVAIVGNWTRIILVIAVGDATDMRHELVADHLWLGLALFAVLVITSLMIAAKYVPRAAGEPSLRLRLPRLPVLSRGGLALVAAAALALPVAARLVEATRYRSASTSIELPAASAGWLGPTSAACPWSPQFAGADAQACAMYESGVHRPVFVTAVAYLRQSRGRELIRGAATAPGGSWRPLDTEVVDTPLVGVPRARAQSLADSAGMKWLMWYWYQLGSTTTPFDSRMKLAEATALPPAAPAVLVAIATPCHSDCSGADAVLRDYLNGHPALASVAKRRPQTE